MGGSILSRRTAGLTLAVITATGTALAATAPANAAPAPANAAPAPAPQLTLDTLAATALVPGSAAAAQVPLFYTSNTGKPVSTAATVTIDFRGLAKVAAVTLQGNCTVKNLVATCTDQLASYGEPNIATVTGSTGLNFTPVKGAALGAQGSYTISAQAGGYKVVGGSSTVTVGGPSLKLAGLRNASGLRVGSTVSEPMSFSNVGDRPAAGSEVVFELTPGLAFEQHYRNCQSANLGGGYTAELCRFGGTVALGEKVGLNSPLALKVTPQALYTQLRAFALPAGDPTVVGIVGPGIVWHAGSGPLLGLRVLAAGHATSAPAGSVEQYDTVGGNSLDVGLTARNTADFGVTGAKASGEAGTDVTVTLGLSDHGPASLVGDDSAPGLQFTLPPGTSAVRIPGGCGLEDAYVPGVYYCGYDFQQSFDIPAGEQLNFPFVLRINKVIKGATGKVALYGPVPFDPNPHNNSAVVTVN
jgi:hypothetical protein